MPQYGVSPVVPVGEETLVVTHKNMENENKPLPFYNVTISAFISSWAQLILYELIEDVGYEKVLYVDTDSIMYIQNEHESPLLTRNCLGELTDDIPKGWEMDMFVGLGQNNYAYRIRNLAMGK